MTSRTIVAHRGYDAPGSGLHAVRVELDRSLTRARHQIEQYLESPDEREPLLQAAEELHQIRGTASIVQCFGVAVLAEEIKRSALDLGNGQTPEVAASQSALTDAVVQLSDYIDALLAGFDDCVLALQPVINELRLARGQSLLTETDLFVAQMHALALDLPAPPTFERNVDAQAMAARHLTAYRGALVRWLRDSQSVASLSMIGRIAEQIAAEAREPRVHELWRAMAACVEAILTGALGDLLEVKRLFGRAGQQLQVLAESGEGAAAAQLGDLSYQLMYYIGRSRARGSRAASLRAAFQLDAYLPAPERVERLQRRLRGPTTSLLGRVASEIRVDLAVVKDTVDLAVRTGGRNSAELGAALGRLRQVSSALEVLGLGVLHRFVLQRLQSLQALAEAPSAPLPDWMEFATGILRIEQSLEESLFQQLGKGYRDPDADAEFAQRTPHDSDWRQGLAAVLRESLVNLAKLKDNFDGLLKTGEGALLADCSRLIGEVASAIEIVGVERAAHSLGRVRRFVQDSPWPMLRERPAAAALFAEVIAAAEYYLESWRDGLPQSELRLDELDRRLDQLESSPIVPADMAPAAAASSPIPETVAPALQPIPEPAPVPPAAVDEVDPAIREVFLEEAEEVLQALARRIPKWLREPNDREALAEIRRAFHTFKGSGRMVGAARIGDFAFAIENLLNRCLDGTIAVDGAVAEVVRETLDRLPGLVDDFREGREPPQAVATLAERAFRLATDHDAIEAAGLRDLFRRDASERLALVRAWLTELPRGDPEFGLPNEIVRAFHTLRGAGSLVQANHIGEIAGRVEDYLECLRGGGLALPKSALPLLDELVATLRDWVGAFDGDPGAAPEFESWIRRIDALQADVPETAVRDASDRQLAEIFAGEAFELVETIEASVRAWARAPDAGFHGRDIRSTLHTLHGAALMSSCPPLAAVAEALYERMDSVTGVVPKAAFFEHLLALCEGLFQMLDAYHGGERGGDPSPWLVSVAALDAREAQATGSTATVSAAPATLPVVSAPAAASDATIGPAVAQAVEFAMARDAHGDEELGNIFREEAAELLQSADQQAAALARDAQDWVAATELRRIMHTLKGSARMAGFPRIGEIADGLEQRGEAIARSQGNADAAFFEYLNGGMRRIREMLNLAPAVPVEPPAHWIGEPAEGGQEPRGEASVGPPVDQVPTLDSISEFEPAPLPAGPATAAQVAARAEVPEAGEVRFDSELAEIFSAEATELLEALDDAFGNWSRDALDEAALRDFQRTLHTLKGGARMAGLAAMGAVAHDIETQVNRVEHAVELATPEVFAALAAQIESLHHMQDTVLRGQIPPPPPIEPALAVPPAAGSAEPGPARGPQPVVEAPPAPPAPRESGFDPILFWQPDEEPGGLAASRREMARVPVDRLDAMLNEAGEVSIYRSRLEQHNVSLQGSLKDMAQTVERVRDQLRLMDIETEAQIAARGLSRGVEQDHYGGEFDPLEMDRYSRMQELSRALSESLGDLSALQRSMDQVVVEAETLLMQQGRVNTDIQTGLMNTLMVPFVRQVQRLQRVVRQTATENGKQVELEFSGIDSELDRNVLERMTAPLEHLLRNAVVHGIELPEARLGAGKSATGTVRVSLRREGTQLLIELRDDGRGLDFAAIRDTAIRRGLMPPDAEIGDEAVAQFILAPGFSTAGKLTQDAGRGIGMDVVASEVKQLGGTLELASETGRGARFLIRLPLTLAISQALLVAVGEEQYAVPLPSVEGIARLIREDLPRYFDADGPALSYGGHEYPVRYLGDYIGVPLRGDLESKSTPAILVRIGEGLGAGERRVAVVVDQLLGNREVVSKAVGPQISSISGVSGATILADGRVVLILDVPALVQDRARRELVLQSLRNDRFAETGDTSIFDSSSAAEPKQDTVMVVDDSITMRRIAERLLVRNGFRVVSAKDGLDAMALLQTEQPAAVLLDIEMPRADGFEVAAFIRNTGRIARVPIIMITSRSGEKHRERAHRLGVNRYLIKPYQEEQLMNEVRSVLSDAAAA